MRSLPQRLWYAFWLFLSRIIAIAAFDYRYYAPGPIPREGRLILAPNHQSFLDPWLVGLPHVRHVSYLARDSLYRFKPFGWFIGSLNALPVKRGTQAARAGVDASLRALERGVALVLFPEGTRSVDGELGEMKRGIELIARRADCLVVPIWVEGSFEVWPRNRLLPAAGSVRVHVGRPLKPSARTSEKKSSDRKKIMDDGSARDRRADRIGPDRADPDRENESVTLLDQLGEAYRALRVEARKRHQVIRRGL